LPNIQIKENTKIVVNFITKILQSNVIINIIGGWYKLLLILLQKILQSNVIINIIGGWYT